MNPETAIQGELLKAAPFVLKDLRMFRRNILRVKIEGRVIKVGIKGQCDIYGIVRGGRHIEVEVKWIGGTLRPDQKVWRDWCIAMGVPWILLQTRAEETQEQNVARWIEELRILIAS